MLRNTNLTDFAPFGTKRAIYYFVCYKYVGDISAYHKTSKIVVLVKIVNASKPLTVFLESLILDVTGFHHNEII